MNIPNHTLPSYTPIPEPSLRFHPERQNDIDLHPLRGLRKYGPYSRGMPLSAPDPIRLAFICPDGHFKALKVLFDEFLHRHKPRERRDYLVEFPSFASAFGVGLDPPQSPDDLRVTLLPRDHVSKALDSEAPAEKMAELVHSAIRGLYRMRTHFDVAILYLPDSLSNAFRSPSEDELSDFDLHDSVKALSSSLQVPLQVLNDDAMNYPCRCSVLWRLSIALYAKAGGIPWKLDSFEDRHAYVGLSYCIRKFPEPRFVTCCSQIFDSQGTHLRFLLYESHEGQYEGDNPYLPRQDMYRVMTRTLSLYQLQKGGPPSRLVMHKTTHFTQEEIEGCVDALGTVDNLELLTLTQDTPWQGIRIDRPKDDKNKKGLPAFYPLDRGAILPLGLFSFLLWAQGNCPGISDRAYFKEGKGIPHPIRVTRSVGAGGFHEGAREIIGLTKMNWNNDSLYDSLPVTISYASILARIVRRMGSLSNTPYDFRYFM
jgi:hypothetical protein